MNAPEPTSLVGSTVEKRYVLRALIGQGGSCTVYRAEDQKRGLQVAVKVLPAARAVDTELSARFQREAAAGKRISHSNVVSITDSGKLDDGSLYLVMELLDGVSLGSLVERQRLPIARALPIARQMLLALAAAHELGIVHRDVKPDNVMLLHGDLVKLVDFGIASNDRAAFKLTAAGLAFGTPEYISPEMAMGLPTDARSDLYAVGIVLYQMVTGKLPFEHRDHKQLLRMHISDPPPPPSSLAPDVPSELETVILRALAKLPEERFESARAMIEALDAVDKKLARRRYVPIVLGLVALVAAAIWWYFRTS